MKEEELGEYNRCKAMEGLFFMIGSFASVHEELYRSKDQQTLIFRPWSSMI